jgi:hypothetical protein
VQPRAQETESRSINLNDDEPRALQAMLRYLYTLDCKRIFRRDDPLFSDVERDLDVFVIADKYDIQPLKKYMNDNLVLFYETDKRPPPDPKGWSAKNQAGFANVLMKLYRLEMETTSIRKAITNFIVRRGHKVMQWRGVQDAIEADGALSNDLIIALLAAKKDTDSRINVLESDKDDLEDQLAEALVENEALEGEIEDLNSMIQASYMETYDSSRFVAGQDVYDYCDVQDNFEPYDAQN